MVFYKPIENIMISLLILGFLAYNIIQMFIQKDVEF